MPEDRRAPRLQFDEHGKDGEHGAQQHQGKGGEADIHHPLRRQVPCVASRGGQLHQRGALLPNRPWVDAGDARRARSCEQATAARQRRVGHEREIAIRQGTGNENRIGASIVDHPGELTERAARRTPVRRHGGNDVKSRVRTGAKQRGIDPVTRAATNQHDAARDTAGNHSADELLSQRPRQEQGRCEPGNDGCQAHRDGVGGPRPQLRVQHHQRGNGHGPDDSALVSTPTAAPVRPRNRQRQQTGDRELPAAQGTGWNQCAQQHA